MLKGKFAIALAAAALLSWQVAGVETVNSGIVDPCSSSASSATGVIFGCPQGDGSPLAGAGLTISVTVKDNTGAGILGIPAGDIWLVGCSGTLELCGGSLAINASGATDSNGETTITGDIATGGCDTGVYVIVQGIPLDCASCVPVSVRTADFVAPFGTIGLADFAFFGSAFPPYPPNAYNACADFVAPYATPVALADFAQFGAHFGHVC